VVATVGVLTGALGGVDRHLAERHQKVLAYSTVSQLGYCSSGGVGAFFAGTQHLITHAFFKACRSFAPAP